MPENELYARLVGLREQVSVEIHCLTDQWLFRSIGGWDVDVFLSIAFAGSFQQVEGVETFADCMRLCNARSWCSHALHGIHKTACQMYDLKVSSATTPGLYGGGWNCAVKK
ncbi:hypothetical protein NW759_016470 [Fusarium solani]|nr:hypothetical protein NW759_016470 [Fusarium solani]